MNIVDVNEKACQLCGYSKEEIIAGIFEFDNLKETLYSDNDTRLYGMRIEDAPQLIEWIFKHKKGHFFWAEVSLQRVVLGEEDYILASMRDVSERKVMEKVIRQHRDNLKIMVAERTQELEKANIKLVEQAQILELAHDYIILCGMDYKIIYWNRGSEVGYGWMASEAVGHVASSLLNTQYPLALEDIKDRLLTEGHWEGELTHTRKDGQATCGLQLPDAKQGQSWQPSNDSAY